MPNLTAPKGLTPIRYLSGAAWDGAYSTYCVFQTDVNQINVGDTVKSFAGADANGVPAVTKALGTDICRGVMIGIVATGLNNPSLVATTLDLNAQNVPAAKNNNYYIAVVDDPFVLFDVSEDGSTALVAAQANKNVSLTVANPTSPRQNSATVLLNSSVAVTATLPFKLMGLTQRPDNTYGLWARWLVKFNTHELLGGTAGI
ncbi:MAG: hypothetical protein K2Q97_02550 [Burkholderiaceae bacterium]|nr:hypothetical protein [Burkholderiaceae bacterium]